VSEARAQGGGSSIFDNSLLALPDDDEEAEAEDGDELEVWELHRLLDVDLGIEILSLHSMMVTPVLAS
jgi:hypothetical protein